MADRLVFVGIVGIFVTMILIFTPLLPRAFSAIGLHRLVQVFDAFLVPALLFFICLTAISMWRHSHHRK